MQKRLKLVTDFGELKAGGLVVVKPCGWCGRKHRVMLLSFGDGVFTRPNGDRHYGPRWLVAPNSVHDSGRTYSISPFTVALRRLYLVDTGLEQTETIEKAQLRPLERVR